MMNISDEIKRANREVYNKMTTEQYNLNESIFNEKRKIASEKVLRTAAQQSGKEKYLDIGTGTGNLLRLGEGIFDHCFGVDISDNLLIQIKHTFENTCLAASDAENIPFKSGTFNCVSCYAMLHHLFTHDNVFKECYRLLKDGGTLYTDHDPNYFLNRFYHLIYKIRHLHKPGFGSEANELAEFHNTMSPGINPEKLKELLTKTGFSEVRITYRHSDREHWDSIFMKLTTNCLRLGSKVIPAKSFFSHFSIIAVK